MAKLKEAAKKEVLVNLDIDRMTRDEVCIIKVDEIYDKIVDALSSISEDNGIEFYIEAQFVKSDLDPKNSLVFNLSSTCSDCLDEDSSNCCPEIVIVKPEKIFKKRD